MERLFALKFFDGKPTANRKKYDFGKGQQASSALACSFWSNFFNVAAATSELIKLFGEQGNRVSSAGPTHGGNCESEITIIGFPESS